MASTASEAASHAAEPGPKETFYRHFQLSVTTLEDEIDQLETLSTIGGEREDAQNNILAGISRLNSEVADASEYIPAYDIRTYAQAMKAITDKFNEKIARLDPRGGARFFRFRDRNRSARSSQSDSRHMISGIGGSNTSLSDLPSVSKSPPPPADRDALGDLPAFSKNYNAELSRPGATSVRMPSFSTAKDIALSDHNGLHLILPTSASHATSAGSVINIRHSVIDMSVPTMVGEGAPFAQLMLKNIAKSLIIAGHVNGATHITGVEDSIIVVAARQVRIHECKNVDLYLHCTSEPIIEDCTGMRFAPLPKSYMSASDEQQTNQWDKVQDFKWLKATHSPNWTTVPEENQIADKIWTSVVPGGPTYVVDDILKAVGVAGR